ncbi:MAG: Na+/H+ antiporter subunit E [Anaerolineae bacterium]|nr:Na+/H+ antiporter subunit E [Anaerolineales bacterium]MCQ3978768.1 Na+/H+ antiporter subunit E [Anaerolineae bacterium]
MFLLNILLALAWTALTGQFDPVNFMSGFVLGYLVLWLAQRMAGPSNYFKKVYQIISFVLFFMDALIRANLRVAYEVITPPYTMRPGIVAIPLEVKTDAAITLLANLITLTPGTLSLDVSADRRVLYVHSMYVDDVEQFRREIKEGFERRVLEVFQ